MNPPLIITDNAMRAAIDAPEKREIVTSMAAVIGLPPGTRVQVLEYAVGHVCDGPCHAARVMIARGDLVEVSG
jgi:hypothetical protein